LTEATLKPFVLVDPVLVVVHLFGKHVPEDGFQPWREDARVEMRLVVMGRMMRVMVMRWGSRREG
jgi:hypothetical protein